MKIEINGCSIHYRIIGEGKPVLCLHGFPEDHEVMVGCLEPVFRQVEGYQRIYLDLPGMGRSTAGEDVSCADNMLKLIQDFVHQVIGSQKFLLVGQSYGGYLSLGLTYSNSNAMEGLFLLCPCTVADRNKRNLPTKQLLERSKALVPTDAEKEKFSDFLEMAVIATEATWMRYKQEIFSGLERADEAFVTTYQKTGYELSFESEFEALVFDKPTMILTGRQDDCVGYQDAFRLMDSFSRGSFQVLDKAGHNLQIEQPALFSEAFSRWLRHF
ncbi:alpha/beta fold hydrolase [Candidatus Enterococcus clewellii]|uniref:AB hydrolase-1 domain-containing protein n=1 Tax=Candidatus Enterococcus clewellii TaxID=1834193 RepID=A0A242KDD9_9ENTE|nr:alpha/beta hydrolase [Enterococcus sp. 9E7_DIV0242]OTP18560.1 hypothetical protein A5888_000374 [Enterococcus sp. 9E7_DIV0242]